MRVALLLSLFVILVAPAARAEQGTIALMVQPADVEIWIDDQIQNIPPSMQVMVAPGAHMVGISKENYLSQRFDIEVTAGAVTTVEATLRPKGAAPTAPAVSPGPVFRDCQDRDGAGHYLCPEMVVIPPGSFMMGASIHEYHYNWVDTLFWSYSLEQPQRRVTIAYPFAVGRYEITFDEWDACEADGACSTQPFRAAWGRGRLPMLAVSWNDTRKYLAWLSRKTGKTYRLLSEAEWEYAARAGTPTPFYTGETLTSEQANINDRCSDCAPGSLYGRPDGVWRMRPVVVGSFSPNGFGLYDMLGNLGQWVEDCWEHYGRGQPSDGRPWTPAGCKVRVVRGGSFATAPAGARSASRDAAAPDEPQGTIGFRVARSMEP